jgi:hypothetical protein
MRCRNPHTATASVRPATPGAAFAALQGRYETVSARPSATASGVKDVNGKPIKIPGPDHPIAITPAREGITVTVAGRHIADTREALTLKEAGYPPVHYYGLRIWPKSDGLIKRVPSKHT